MFDYVKSMFPAHSDEQIQRSISKHKKNEDAIVSELLNSQPQRKPVSAPVQQGGYAVQQVSTPGNHQGGKPVQYGQTSGEFGYNQSYHVSNPNSGRAPPGYSHPNQMPGNYGKPSVYPTPDQFNQGPGHNGMHYPSYPPTGSPLHHGNPHAPPYGNIPHPSYPPTGMYQNPYPSMPVHSGNNPYGSQPQQSSIDSLPRVPSNNPTPQRNSGNPIMSNDNYPPHNGATSFPSSPIGQNQGMNNYQKPNAPRLESHSKEEILNGLEEIVETQNKVIRVLRAKLSNKEKEASDYNSQVLDMSFNNELDESTISTLSKSVMELLDTVATNQLNPQQRSLFYRKIEAEAKKRTQSRFVEDSDSN
eukprot:TRINITY_DN9051_c0_g1_i1.p1 TRINITY_DN9051_c0_g1~~TRINITY_DN9051_c0_g1_i1.p1  ORF type:complete len:380 (+),score=85.62 TRINITY_DN9051_c0_g1_i1:65-1141(+)